MLELTRVHAWDAKRTLGEKPWQYGCLIKALLMPGLVWKILGARKSVVPGPRHKCYFLQKIWPIWVSNESHRDTWADGRGFISAGSRWCTKRAGIFLFSWKPGQYGCPKRAPMILDPFLVVAEYPIFATSQTPELNCFFYPCFFLKNLTLPFHHQLIIISLICRTRSFLTPK